MGQCKSKSENKPAPLFCFPSEARNFFLLHQLELTVSMCRSRRINCRWNEEDSTKHCDLCNKRFEFQQMYRQPTCKHIFHCQCIYQWAYEHFEKEGHCPICNVYLVHDF